MRAKQGSHETPCPHRFPYPGYQATLNGPQHQRKRNVLDQRDRFGVHPMPQKWHETKLTAINQDNTIA
jgi:hypothetical protein